MTLPTANSLIATILWASPVVQTLAGIAMMMLWRGRRRETPSPNNGLAFGVIAAAIVLHVGYVLAPLWWDAGRYLLGAATMLPVAIIVVGSLAVAVLQADLVRKIARSNSRRRVVLYAAAGLLALAYVGPLLLMLAAWA